MKQSGRGGGEQPLVGRGLRRGVRRPGSRGVSGGAMDRFVGNVAARCLAVAVGILLAGCTMCPDPYDYSGPVPNGSSPHNDFRARSNGILPLGAARCPWPTIVRNDATPRHAPGCPGRRMGTPTPAADGPVTVVAAETAVDDIEPVSVLVAGGVEQAGTSSSTVPSSRDPWLVVPDFGDEAAPIAAAEPAVTVEPEAPTTDPAPVTTTSAHVPADQPTVVLPLLTETPGWRPRGTR